MAVFLGGNDDEQRAAGLFIVCLMSVAAKQQGKGYLAGVFREFSHPRA
jgi:hypothetical protein